jgi:hypothetical protein
MLHKYNRSRTLRPRGKSGRSFQGPDRRVSTGDFGIQFPIPAERRSDYPGRPRSGTDQAPASSKKVNPRQAIQNPVPALPAVDLGRETVVLAATGTRKNGCYSIDITRCQRGGQRSHPLEVTESVPWADLQLHPGFPRVSFTGTFVERAYSSGSAGLRQPGRTPGAVLPRHRRLGIRCRVFAVRVSRCRKGV